MRVIVAGSRWIWDQAVVDKAIANSGFAIATLISGANRNWDARLQMWTGVDLLGERWAESRGIPVEQHPFKEDFGKAGGPIRNREMAAAADALILVWDGKSKGSASMKREAKARRLPIREWLVGDGSVQRSLDL